MITLYGTIPAKKNNKMWTGKYLISSKKYREWEKAQMDYLKGIGYNEKFERCHIEYNFYRPDNRKRDLSNIVDSAQDMLVKYGTLPDDNWKVIESFTAISCGVDKENPRVEIFITRLD